MRQITYDQKLYLNIPLSKLPMRQITVLPTKSSIDTFSKLPMRQITVRINGDGPSRFSKLPMRQITWS